MPSKWFLIDSAGEGDGCVMETQFTYMSSIPCTGDFAEITAFNSAYKAVASFHGNQRIEMWAQKQISYLSTAEWYLVRKQKAFTSYPIDASCNKCDSYVFLSYLSPPAVPIKVFLGCNRWSEHSFEIYLDVKPC